MPVKATDGRPIDAREVDEWRIANFDVLMDRDDDGKVTSAQARCYLEFGSNDSGEFVVLEKRVETHDITAQMAETAPDLTTTLHDWIKDLLYGVLQAAGSFPARGAGITLE